MNEEKGFKVTDHELVPDHEILSDEEAEEVLEEFEVEPNQLPKLNSKGPVAQEIGAEDGDIVKIERESFTAGKSTTYRLVV